MEEDSFTQEQLLNFIAKTMSLVENGTYTVRNIDLSSKHTFLLKNEVVVGHMTIIADEEYWQLVDSLFLNSLNYTAIQYSEKAQVAKRALFLKYSYENFGSKNKYKNMPNKNTLVKIGSNIDDFPYLSIALDNLKNNAKRSGNYSKEIIEATITDIIEKVESYRSISSDSTKNSKELVKRLNEVNLYSKNI